jgi:phosphoglycerate kinase
VENVLALQRSSRVVRHCLLIDSHVHAHDKVLRLSDLNVPQDDQGNFTEDTRIRASVPGHQGRVRRLAPP